MPFDSMNENYYALRLAISAPIRLSPEGAFLSLALVNIQRNRRIKQVGSYDIAEVKEMAQQTLQPKTEELCGLIVEASGNHIKTTQEPEPQTEEL